MSSEMVRAIKLFCQNVFVTHRDVEYCYTMYYFTTFVQLCWHDAIDECYRSLIQFVIFGEFYHKKSDLMIVGKIPSQW